MLISQMIVSKAIIWEWFLLLIIGNAVKRGVIHSPSLGFSWSCGVRVEALRSAAAFCAFRAAFWVHFFSLSDEDSMEKF